MGWLWRVGLACGLGVAASALARTLPLHAPAVHVVGAIGAAELLVVAVPTWLARGAQLRSWGRSVTGAVLLLASVASVLAGFILDGARLPFPYYWLLVWFPLPLAATSVVSVGDLAQPREPWRMALAIPVFLWGATAAALTVAINVIE